LKLRFPRVSETPGITQASISDASLEVLAPSAFSPLRAAAFPRSSLPHSTTSASRFSQPPDAFFRPEPAGLISCQIRSWGRPPELSPSRAAARRFRRHSPLDIGSTHNESPCLQGFSPRESPPPNLSDLDRNPARSSPGPFSLQGFHSFCDDLVFTRSPFLWLPARTKTDEQDPLQGFFHSKIGLSLLRLPTLMGFFAF
jgi:hypothetical protein